MACLKGKADKTVKIILLCWVILSGILGIVVGVVHFTKMEGGVVFVKPTKLESQPLFAMVVQAILCCLFGLMLTLLPFSSFFRKLPLLRHFTFAYNRLVLIFFYLVGGFIVFSMCGILGIVIACLYWLSAIIVFILFFLISKINKFDTIEGSVEKKKEMSTSSSD